MRSSEELNGFCVERKRFLSFEVRSIFAGLFGAAHEIRQQTSVEASLVEEWNLRKRCRNPISPTTRGKVGDGIDTLPPFQKEASTNDETRMTWSLELLELELSTTTVMLL